MIPERYIWKRAHTAERKAPVPSNIKEELIKLIALQKIDTAVFDLKKEHGEAPAKLAQIDAVAAEMKARLKGMEEDRQKTTLEQKKKEGDLAGREEEIKKAQAQLGQLKTNKEYQAKLAEIESLKADKSVIEEEILKLMDAVEAAKAPIETERQRLAEEEKKFAQQRAALKGRVKQIEAEIQNLEGKRRIAAAGIDKAVLQHYEHVLGGRASLAIVPVKENSCQGCHMLIPPQVINEIRMHERLISCETCTRILYLEDDVGAA